jgi:hypothetical protein
LLSLRKELDSIPKEQYNERNTLIVSMYKKMQSLQLELFGILSSLKFNKNRYEPTIWKAIYKFNLEKSSLYQNDNSFSNAFNLLMRVRSDLVGLAFNSNRPSVFRTFSSLSNINSNIREAGIEAYLLFAQEKLSDTLDTFDEERGYRLNSYFVEVIKKAYHDHRLLSSIESVIYVPKYIGQRLRKLLKYKIVSKAGEILTISQGELDLRINAHNKIAAVDDKIDIGNTTVEDFRTKLQFSSLFELDRPLAVGKNGDSLFMEPPQPQEKEGLKTVEEISVVINYLAYLIRKYIKVRAIDESTLKLFLKNYFFDGIKVRQFLRDIGNGEKSTFHTYLYEITSFVEKELSKKITPKEKEKLESLF